MPFGTIQVIPAAQPPKKKIEKQTSSQASQGMARFDVLIVAQSIVEATDFLCGMYFDMTRMTGGSAISVYTRDFQTISQLAERKHMLEAAISKLPGTEIRRVNAEDDGLTTCILTIGQTGNQLLTLDINIRCVTPENMSRADAVFVLFRPGEGLNMEAVDDDNASNQVFWIAGGFEDREVYLENGTTVPLNATLRTDLRSTVRRKGGFFACTQVYGGLEFVRREDDAVVFRSSARSREYTPVGCHIPVFTAITEHARHSDEAEGSGAIQELYSMIRDSYYAQEPARLSWCSANGEVD